MLRVKITHILISFLLITNTLYAKSAESCQTPSSTNDSINISLLTASQGKYIYEKFGHTGIRVHIPSQNFDVVYHYGLFSFEEPHFIYRFVKGETDYMIGAITYSDFMMMYAMRGSSVRELKLNMTTREATQLFDALHENMRPENLSYRYSFLYDNCATRPLEIIYRNIEGETVLQNTDKNLPTYRQLIHNSVGADSWVAFGIDMLLDAETDEPIEMPSKPFLPDITEQVLAKTIISTGSINKLRPLAPYPPVEVLRATERLSHNTTPRIFTPTYVTTLLLLIVLFFSIKEIIQNRHNRILDTIVALFFGLFGIVIYFLLFFSEHPAVSANYNAFWLQPVWLLIVPLIWTVKGKKFLYCYHFINFALLLIFAILIFFIRQNLNAAFIPLILISLLRSATYLKVERSRRVIKKT